MKKLVLLLALFFIFANVAFAQEDDCYFNTLEDIALDGTVIYVATGTLHPHYYLDINGDQTPDYFLNLGPHWYVPEEGGATLPNEGDAVSVTGKLGIQVDPFNNLPVVIVYEINGLFWRDPCNFDPSFGGGPGNHHGGGMGGGMNGEFTEVTVSGTVIVDELYMHPMYYLDEDGDTVPEYHLNFGPFWYEPESGATRPLDGEFVTITGALLENMDESGYAVVIVWELNGELWRDPFEPGGGHNGGGGHHGFHGGMGGHGGSHGGGMNGGMWGELEEITLTGIAIVDSVYIHPHYYIDINGDNEPDYRLNFGPHWYEPESGATRPQPGDEITIVGGLVDYEDPAYLNMVIVWEINGLVWQEQAEPGWGGHHYYNNTNTPTYVYSPTDQQDWTMLPAHAMGGMMGPNHMYMEMLETELCEIPSMPENTFCGYQYTVLDMDQQGQDMMGMNGRVHFNNALTVQFHYTDAQLQQQNMIENQLRLYRWDQINNAWTQVGNVNVNINNNTLTINTNDVYSFYAVTATPEILGVEDGDNASELKAAVLYQNYPNPFNPATQIQFQLSQPGNVSLKVYDLAGRLVKTLVNSQENAGIHQLHWDGTSDSGLDVTSGVYFYSLTIDGKNTTTKQMTLLK